MIFWKCLECFAFSMSCLYRIMHATCCIYITLLLFPDGLFKVRILHQLLWSCPYCPSAAWWGDGNLAADGDDSPPSWHDHGNWHYWSSSQIQLHLWWTSLHSHSLLPESQLDFLTGQRLGEWIQFAGGCCIHWVWTSSCVKIIHDLSPANSWSFICAPQHACGC